MKNLMIEPTSSTPAIQFRTDGRMLIEGRSLPEDVNRFYSLLIEWAENLLAEAVKLDINLEYLNSASTKKMLEFLKILDANNILKTLLLTGILNQKMRIPLKTARFLKNSFRKRNSVIMSMQRPETYQFQESYLFEK